jgi:hypothetical protein
MHTTRYNSPRFIRVGNLLMAALGVVTSWMAAAQCGYHFSTRNIVLGSIDSIWFIAALGLFFRWRLAWIGSLIGTGTSACLWCSILFDPSGWPTLSDAEQMYQQAGFIIPIFAFVFTVGECLAFSAVYFGLFIGLVRKQKDLI